MFHCYHYRKRTDGVQVIPGRASMVSLISTRSNYSSILTIGAPSVMHFVDTIDQLEQDSPQLTGKQLNHTKDKENLRKTHQLINCNDLIKLKHSNHYLLKDDDHYREEQMDNGIIYTRTNSRTRTRPPKDDDCKEKEQKVAIVTGTIRPSMSTNTKCDSHSDSVINNERNFRSGAEDHQEEANSFGMEMDALTHNGYLMPETVIDDKVHKLLQYSTNSAILTNTKEISNISISTDTLNYSSGNLINCNNINKAKSYTDKDNSKHKINCLRTCLRNCFGLSNDCNSFNKTLQNVQEVQDVVVLTAPRTKK